VEWDGRHVFCFDYLLSFSPNYVGRDPKLILDADGRIVAVLLGRPEGDDWDDVIAEMARAMDGVRARGVKRGVFKRQERRHRRGDFFVLKGGLTKGPGQKVCVSEAYRMSLINLRLNTARGRATLRSAKSIGGYWSCSLSTPPSAGSPDSNPVGDASPLSHA
jgi:hypothetical protein